MRAKNTILFMVVSLILVLLVNLAGNYRSYLAGESWHYSVLFVLTVSMLSWIASIPISMWGENIFSNNMKPTSQLLLVMLLLALQGTVVMVVSMEGMVHILHMPEQSTYSYINNVVYCILFTLIIGLLSTGQKFLENLRKASADKRQLEQAMIQSQYEALKNQVNPHFLFNSLNTLMVLIPEQPGLATRFVEEMSKVFRYSLQNDGEHTVTVATELKVTESLLFLNKQRFEGKLLIEMNVDDSALQQRIVTHSLLMLAENAIKHNEISTTRPLTISISNEDGYLVMKNTLQRRSQLPDSTNIGLANIKQRYEMAGSKNVVVEETGNMFIVKLPLL